MKLLRTVCLASLMAGACSGSGPFPESLGPLGIIAPSVPQDCTTPPWQVTLSIVEFQISESVRGLVTPGLPACGNTLVRVTWGVEDNSVASVTPVGASAWVTGLAPGSTTVTARVELIEGVVHEAQPETVRVIEAGTPPGGSVVVAVGTTEVRFNQFTGAGGSDQIPVAIPSAGRVEVMVDWTSLDTPLGFFFWEGACLEGPCPGELVINAQRRPVKPRRETVDDLPAGEYTLGIFGVIDPAGDTAPETASYEVRLTPN